MSTTKESLSALRGVPAITADEGVALGNVEHIYLDPETRKLSAIGIKQRHGGESAFVDAADITLIGRDVFLVAAEDRVKPMSGTQKLGRRLRMLRGLPVITDDGTQLGKLEDFDIDREGVLKELHLSEHRTLPVTAAEVRLGSDAIVLPASYVKQVVEEPDREGFLSRVRSWTHREKDDKQPSVG